MEDWDSIIDDEKKTMQGENCNDAYATGNTNNDENWSQLGEVENENEKKCIHVYK